MWFWANMNGELNRVFIRLILLGPLSRERRKDGKSDKRETEHEQMGQKW